MSDGHVLEIPGPGAGWESEFSVTESESSIAGMESDLGHQMSAIQVEPAAFAKVDATKIIGSQAVAASGWARQVREVCHACWYRACLQFSAKLVSCPLDVVW